MVHDNLTSRMRPMMLGAFAVVLLAAGAAGAAPAVAAVPAWSIRSEVRHDLLPGGSGEVRVVATNLGGESAGAAAGPITLTNVLPPGVSANSVSTEASYVGGPTSCSVVSSAKISCESSGPLLPYEAIEITIQVSVDANAPASGIDVANISGGGARAASSSETISLRATPQNFGLEKFEQVALNEDGTPDTQAGSHPFQLVTTIGLSGSSQVKDLHFKLPPGVIGNPTVIPQCTATEFAGQIPGQFVNLCPEDTILGVATFETALFGIVTIPLFNLVPAVGEPAKFGFNFALVPIILDTSIRTGSDYGVEVEVNNINEITHFYGAQVTFWGVPTDPRHDPSRGYRCLVSGYYTEHEDGPCAPPINRVVTPFLTMPTSCTGPLQSAAEGDSFDHPGEFLGPLPYTLHDGAGPVGLDGCNKLRFEPSLTDAPDGQAASTPTGLSVGVHVPQEITLNPTGLAEADVKDTTVALPAGVQLSPSAADGLSACSNAQIGFKGVNSQTGVAEFTNEVPSCPESSKLATVKIDTPLLSNPLKGAVYLAAPQNFAGLPENPFSSLVAMYIVARDPVSGVLVKLPGRVTTNPVSGQVTATFEDTPQLPFEELELHFFGSARAPLTTPPTCGSYKTQASITPWSGNDPATPSSTFNITSGPNGAPCASPQPFTPGFQSGSTNLQASAFTPFTLTMSRPDADQTLSRVEMSMPPGLLGTLSTVKLCPEPQASRGECGPESLIGETVVSAGLGGDPYTVTGGKVYITTAYGGGQYGLSIVNPAKAGPFVLDEGRPIIVRASINVDPHTAALKILSDPLPTILDGIPLQIQHINVTINHAGGFTFNPSNCTKMAINGVLSSSEGATAAVSTPFQVTNCATLAFKPKLAVSTSGKTSRANGASLAVKLTYPTGPFDANIARVKVELPRALPSRLTTLQKACLAAVFDANPANCPAASIVGHARAVTPVLPVPLEGNAYFVSHGGAAFPDLTIVLKGYGTTVDLVGTTFISNSGITSSTFKQVPDVPVGTFELTLPQGRYSALGSFGNLCKKKLAMPTEFIGQNGAAIHQSTPIKTTGCPKAHKAAHKTGHAKNTPRRKKK
jgi:hypothetical protein